MRNAWQRGLYAIADAGLIAAENLGTAVTQAIRGGAVMVQYRDKLGNAREREQRAATLLERCRGHGIPLIINDDPALCRRLGADGVHLGRDDDGLVEARRQLGAAAIIGVSCYNDHHRARVAAAAGADYVAFGRFFPSRTKATAVQADAELLTWASTELTIPVVAIGGITPRNGGALIAAGADLLAVIHGVFGASDIYDVTRHYAALFSQTVARRVAR